MSHSHLIQQLGQSYQRQGFIPFIGPQRLAVQSAGQCRKDPLPFVLLVDVVSEFLGVVELLVVLRAELTPEGALDMVQLHVPPQLVLIDDFEAAL